MRPSIVAIVVAFVPGLAHVLMLLGERVLPRAGVWVGDLLRGLLLLSLLAPLLTPIGTVVLVRRWKNLSRAQRWVACVACSLAWVATIRLVVGFARMENMA